jgi:hypothetical protein
MGTIISLSTMSLSVSQSAMAFQKAQDQKIDQHQQPNMDLGGGGGGVKINNNDKILPRFESLMCERTEVHSFMNDVTAFD